MFLCLCTEDGLLQVSFHLTVIFHYQITARRPPEMRHMENGLESLTAVSSDPHYSQRLMSGGKEELNKMIDLALPNFPPFYLFFSSFLVTLSLCFHPIFIQRLFLSHSPFINSFAPTHTWYIILTLSKCLLNRSFTRPHMVNVLFQSHYTFRYKLKQNQVFYLVAFICPKKKKERCFIYLKFKIMLLCIVPSSPVSPSQSHLTNVSL